MIKIALVDDDKMFLDCEKKIIEYTLAHLDLDAQINIYFDGESFLSIPPSENIDLVFLDIDMPGLDGFQVAKAVREKHKDCFIVFVSSHENLVFNSFEYLPIAFIRKSEIKNEITNVFKRTIELQEINEEYLLIKSDNGNIKCRIDDITYVESDRARVIIYTKNGAYKYIEKIGDLWEDLSKYKFLNPHRCYLVNFNYIKSIRKDEFILIDDTLIPISRHRKKEICKQFESYLRKTI